jgi:hypothetical protein
LNCSELTSGSASSSEEDDESGSDSLPISETDGGEEDDFVIPIQLLSLTVLLNLVLLLEDFRNSFCSTSKFYSRIIIYMMTSLSRLSEEEPSLFEGVDIGDSSEDDGDSGWGF